MPVVRIEKVHNLLRKALNGPNRLRKEQAVAQALYNVEEIREVFTRGIVDEVAKLHRLALLKDEHLTDDALEEGADLAGVIYNLAGAMGYDCLQLICASLSDLFVAMSGRGIRCSDPILVHARAALLASPGMPPLPDQVQRELLNNLKNVVGFFQAHPDPCAKTQCGACPGSASGNPFGQ